MSNDSRLSKIDYLHDFLKVIATLLILSIIISIVLLFWLVGGQSGGEELAAGTTTETEAGAPEAEEAAAEPEAEAEAGSDEAQADGGEAEAEAEVEAIAPTLSGPEGGDVVAGDEVSLVGTGEPSSEVEITANGEVLGTATVDDDGNWSFATTFAEAGDYELQANAVDADRVMISSSEPVSLAVVEPIAEIETPTLDPLAVSEAGLDEEITLTGGGTPGSALDVLANGEVIGTTTVGDDGSWAFPFSLGDPGDYEIQVQTTDAAGNPLLSNSGQLTIASPFTLPAFDVPDFDLSSLFAGDEVELTGTGTPGSEVDILANGEVIGTVTVGDDGTWTFPFSFDPGDYDLQLQSTDPEGNELFVEGFVLPVSLPDVAIPTIDLPDVDLSSLVPGNPFDFSGTAEPGSEIEIVANGEVIGTATVGDDGTWTFPFSLDPGDYELNVRTTGPDGGPVEADPLTFTVAEPEAPAIDSVAPTLTGLTVIEYGTDESINLAGTGTPESTVEVIADGQRFGVAPVDADGNWRFAIAFSDPGEYEIFVQSVDEDGQVIDTTDAETVTITAPVASETFSIIFPADNADIIIGQLTIIGSSDPGLEIEILDGDTLLGSTETAENGEWAFTFEPEEGSHVFSAQLAGGDQSTDSRTVVVGSPAETDCDSNLGISRGDNYIVGTCNTFGTVIERTGATLESLIAANPQIDNPDLIFPGDILNIPAP